MPEPILTMDADDDLPRTIRRARDAKQAREREARERDAREHLSSDPNPMQFFERPAPYSFAGPAGGVATLDVPFSKLMAFSFKVMFAAIPALIVLLVLVWLAGRGLQTLFPDLMKLKVLIYMPK